MEYVAYYRVSTEKQGRSGLGLAAQRKAVGDFIQSRGGRLLAEFTEVESGKENDRQELKAAMHHCDLTGATLIIAKLDRLSRNAAFLLALRDSGVRFIAADMPDANEVTVGIMAVIAQEERKAISKRTKAALAAAKAKGVKLGNPNGAAHLQGKAMENSQLAREVLRKKADEFAVKLSPVIEQLTTSGITSLRGIASELNKRGIKTARGKEWTATAVRNLMSRRTA